MAGFSDAYENKVLDALFGGPALAAPATVYIALLTVAAGETDTGSTLTEASYTGYARKAVLLADWRAAVAGAKKNLNTLDFVMCTGGTSTVIGFAVCDAATAGGVIMSGSLPTASIANNVTPSFPVDGLSLTLD